MRHESTGEPHGLVRAVTEGGYIYECSYKAGKRHGLQCAFVEDKVFVCLFREDK